MMCASFSNESVAALSIVFYRVVGQLGSIECMGRFEPEHARTISMSAQRATVIGS
jgi:hypothetical protein